MSSPIVSVITPTYNQAAFLPETIESVLSQDYPHIDYRVIDDGSTDNTREVLAGYDGRIRWHSHPNRGQTATINAGWRQATGDILIWLNSDDTFLPGAVSRAVDYLERHPECGIVYGDTLFTEADGTPIRRTAPQESFNYERFVVECHNPIPQPSAFIRRRVLDRAGELDPSYYYFMDWDFWLRAGIHDRIDYVPELWSTYRLHPESKTVAQAARSAPELERMYRSYFSRSDIPELIRRREREAFANMHFNSGGYYMKGDACMAALRSGWKAVGAFPAALIRPRMLHQLLFCTWGGTALYRSGRSAYRRLRTSRAA